MLTMVNYILSLIQPLIGFLDDLIIVVFDGKNVTVLGFIGALIVVGVMIRVYMPKP